MEFSTEIKDEVDQETRSAENALHGESVIMNIQCKEYVGINLEATSTHMLFNNNFFNKCQDMKLSTHSAKMPRIRITGR